MHKCVNVSDNLVSITLVEAQLQRSQAWWQPFLLSKTALGVKWGSSLFHVGSASSTPPAMR